MASSVPLVSVSSSIADAEVVRQIFERVFVLGIDAEIGRSEIALDEIDDMRRSATCSR